MYSVKFYALTIILVFFTHYAQAEVKKEFYDNGELKSESTYVGDSLKAQKRYRQDGQVEYEMHMDGNKKIETEYSYHSGGELFRSRPRVNGAIQGLEKDYYPSGKIKAQRNYVDGKKNGNAKGFYENGQVQGDWEFKDGVPVAATIYHPNGKVNLEHQFENGRLNGLTKEYDAKGKLIAKRYYDDDKLTKRERLR